MTPSHESSELVAVERRLMEDYGAALGPDEVTRCFDAAVDAFADVSVRTYVVLLIERRAERELRAAVDARVALGGLPT